MKRSGSQQILRIFSIIGILAAILALLMGALVIIGSGLIGTGDAEVAIEGMTNEEASMVGIGGGIMLLVEGVLCLIEGILGLRAAKDANKIMPVWILAAGGLVLSAAGLVLCLTSGGDSQQIGSNVGSLVGSLLMFWIANNIKNQRRA